MLRKDARSLASAASLRPVLCLLLLSTLLIARVSAQSDASLPQRIQKVIIRPEFAHATFGIEFYSLDTGTVIYALNTDKLFVPSSTTNTLTDRPLLANPLAVSPFHHHA